jgi:molecular chaperone GrpE
VHVLTHTLCLCVLWRAQEISDRVKGNVLEELIPLIDNFEAAKQYIKACSMQATLRICAARRTLTPPPCTLIRAQPDTDGERKIETSYQALYKQMVELFKKMGIEAVPTVGRPFDPAVHEAIMRQPSAEVSEDTVSQEFRKGFRIGGRLIRPATVAVSVPVEGGAPAAEGGTAAEGDAAAAEGDEAAAGAEA